ncbi:cytosine deaminase [Oerskovia turbata]|uniref:Cytosine deaminase n=1 Tax=Oerskovia turbata TaxID=1713 RepID=A0A4Q1L1M2_9CELL|nr:amidohydrolase family protein [Oerskovia turbata]RXR26188.1 cytosine deaminase [Oerskovia turbata]RXR36690.1 cytosine deaminase [Oerskovia turbata]TGJ97379.1 cytosine deaminase [Actinotalea fermentans ATCC 43279 = JCM 9966 = DSM 3133]
MPPFPNAPQVAVSVLRNVRPWGADPVDLHVTDGNITRVTPHSPTEAGASRARTAPGEIDGRGLLALPGFVNAHAHVDKSWWGKPWVSYGGEATTQGRIAHEREHRDELGIPGVDVTVAVLREFLRHGTTAIRTHVDVDLGLGLRGIDVVRESLFVLGGVVDAEIVAFPQDGVLRRPGVLELLDAAAAAGAEHIGGLDPASIDRDPVTQLDGLFEIAERRGVGVDVHLHDGGELGAFQIELMIERTIRAGLQGKVNVAHGFAVGQLPPTRMADLVEAMGDAGISMTTVAPVGAVPLPLDLLREHDVRVGLGTDGIRDLWAPYGTGDLLALTTRLSQLARFRHDEDLVRAARLATSDAAHFVGRPVHDLVEGARADVVLVDAENTMDAVVRAPARALVVAGGQVVARDGEVLV